MSEEMKKIAEKNSEEASTNSTFSTTAKVTSTIKSSSDEGLYSGPCRVCDKKMQVPIKDGKKECTACGAVF